MAAKGLKDDVGEIIDGRFLVVEHVRSTPTTLVYRAEHSGIGRPVELWMLDPRRPHDGPDAARLLRVARASGAVAHPNVQSMIDSGADVLGRPYLAYEWLGGERLDALLARSPDGVGEQRAAHLVIELVEGVRAMHSAGVVHRTIGPDRVAVVPVRGGGEVVKLTGLEDSAFLGEPDAELVAPERLSSPYLAPELRRGHVQPDMRSDVYSLGVLLRALATGNARHDPRRPIGDTARRAIERATAEDPDDRFSDVERFGNAVALLLPGAQRPPRDEMPTPQDPLVADLHYLMLRRSTYAGTRVAPRREARVELVAMLLAIEAIYKRLGREKWDRLVERVPEVERLLPGAGQEDLHLGVPVELATRTLAAADEIGGTADFGLITELGEAVAERGLRRLLPGLPAKLDTNEALQALPDLWRKIAGQGHVDVRMQAPRRVRFTVRGQTDPSLEVCALMAGLARGTMRATGAHGVEVYATSCQALGDPQCVLGVGWEE